jgi:F-type H+-transporting ATPase subunit gamma
MYREHTHLKNYQTALSYIFTTVNACTPTWNFPAFLQTYNKPAKELFILIGSQKGLCGSFNATITHWIDKNVTTLKDNNTDIMVLSKKVNEYLQSKSITKAKTLPELKLISVDKLTHTILKTITNANNGYTRVVVVANCPKTFMSHEYKATQLIPFTAPEKTSSNPQFDYIQTHNPDLVLNTLVEMHLMYSIHAILFTSLLGEQASRFIAMDNATRNANNFLEVMKLEFNKMRQAKITKELAELASAFDTQF